MKRLPLALLLLSVLPFAAGAKDDFRNLPGVHDPEKLKVEAIVTVCTSQLERQHATRYRNGLAYRTYRCRYGRAWVGSDSSPNMIEYRKYKQR
jgi:hypothetical protein